MVTSAAGRTAVAGRALAPVVITARGQQRQRRHELHGRGDGLARERHRRRHARRQRAGERHQRRRDVQHLTVNKNGTGYTLTATSGALTVTSSAFNVAVGAPAQLAFAVQPSNAIANAAGAALKIALIVPPMQ